LAATPGCILPICSKFARVAPRAISSACCG
jgi:hypothetical protein